MTLHLIQNGSSIGEHIVIDHFPFILGRSSSCDFQVYHPMVSRRHCEVKRMEKGLKIADLESSNGTYVNGERVIDWRELKDGDEINLGCLSYRVTVSPSKN